MGTSLILHQAGWTTSARGTAARPGITIREQPLLSNTLLVPLPFATARPSRASDCAGEIPESGSKPELYPAKTIERPAVSFVTPLAEFFFLVAAAHAADSLDQTSIASGRIILCALRRGPAIFGESVKLSAARFAARGPTGASGLIARGVAPDSSVRHGHDQRAVLVKPVPA